MREFGMIPVLPGFAGHVPGALKTHYPNATFTQSPDWCGFEPQYGSDTLLEAIDPLFTKIGSQFNSYVHADFGDPTGKETPIFNADMYNEMEPNSADPSYLAASNAAIYQAMISVNPNSIYLMQAWLFHEDFWNYDRVKAFLSGVPTGGMIILDLNSEEGPVWNEYDSFFNHSWVWCSLITYGGRRGIYGDLNRLALSPYVDLNASATMHGIGFTPEATEMIPSQFDIAMEAGWRSVPISDPIDWMKQWGVRRYGSLSPSLATAQEILSIAAYNSDIDTASLEGYPSVGDSMSHNTNATGIFNALQLYVNAVENNEVVTTGPFNYDITDLSRQVLINYFSDLHTMLASRFARTNSSASVYSIISAINTLFISLDSVLSADINYLLGTWIQDAASWGNGDDEWTNLLVFNARNQITLWGPRGEINDYAAKNGWADLVSSYYFPRWTILFDAMKNSSSTGIPINQASVDANITSFELSWGLQTTDRPKTIPSGIEPITLATQLVKEYFKYDATLWTILPNTMISLPPKSTQFVNIGSVGQAAVSGDCPFTNHGDGSSLVNCQANCLTAPDRCNAINYSPSNKDCVWRMCSDPLHPILSPGYGDYSYYGLNETASSKIMTSWHTDIGILSQLCLSDPACNGFASDGSVITDVSRTIPMSGVNLYVRN
jgi:alpha-N-acetylglucosaminidase